MRSNVATLPIVRLLCAKEIAGRLGVTPRVAAKLLRTHQIKGFKLSGKYWRTTEVHLEFFVSRSMHEHAASGIVQLKKVV